MSSEIHISTRRFSVNGEGYRSIASITGSNGLDKTYASMMRELYNLLVGLRLNESVEFHHVTYRRDA